MRRPALISPSERNTEKDDTMPPPEQWQLSGNAAVLYERYVVPYILGPWAPGLVERAALQLGDRVVDVACGTGVVARHAAQRVGVEGHVTGLDLNPGMLAVARSLPPPAGAAMTWVESSAVAMDPRCRVRGGVVSTRVAVLSRQTSGTARDASGLSP
jgi:SAM-dependent methyltransferase